MDNVASKQQTAGFFIHHNHTHKKRDKIDKKKTDKPDGKPVLCQRKFSSVIRAVFLFYTVELQSLTSRVWDPLQKMCNI